MRIAWFRSTPLALDTTESATPDLIRALAARVRIDVITASTAHAFVPAHALDPYDVCVFEPRKTPESAFIFGYLFHYPGVLVLQDRSLHDVRALALRRRRLTDAYISEFTFNHGHAPRAVSDEVAQGSWPMLRALVLASRATIVFDEERQRALVASHPTAHVDFVPPGVAGPEEEPAADAAGPLLVAGSRATTSHRLVEAVERARHSGADLTLVPESWHRTAGCNMAVVSLEALDDEPSVVDALAAMARGHVVIVHEREATAAWPALDPHVWRPRVASSGDPVAISIDPRDEVHSLATALARLAREPAARQHLGAAARRWWAQRGHVTRSADVVEAILHGVTLRVPAPHPHDWPAHLAPDGFDPLRHAGAELGLELDPP